MYNYVMLIGKVKEVKDEMVVNNTTTHLIISCTIPVSADGVQEADDIDVRLYDCMADIAKERLVIGQTITVKGRLHQSNHPSLCYVIGERIIWTHGEDER